MMLGKLYFFLLCFLAPKFTITEANRTTESTIKIAPTVPRNESRIGKNIANTSTPDKTRNILTNSTLKKRENFNESYVEMGCSFDDNLLVDDSSNDYGAFQTGPAFQWGLHQNGIEHEVPFFFRNDVKKFDQEEIKKAMVIISENTCIAFSEMEENDMPEHHLEIFINYMKEDCNGNGGVVYQPGRAARLTLNFSNGFECEDEEMQTKDRNLILHELGHVVGLAHTQKRPDSNQFVQINSNCVIPGNEDQFAQQSWKEVKNFSIPYKCNSMMHYEEHTFSTGPDCPTVVEIPGQCPDGIGNKGPIPEDWQLINRAYNCQENSIGNK